MQHSSPYSGDKYASACFAAQTPANDDWIITQSLLLTEWHSHSWENQSLISMVLKDLMLLLQQQGLLCFRLNLVVHLLDSN